MQKQIEDDKELPGVIGMNPIDQQEQSPTALELAKQGNPKAIAALMNRSLQAKGITVKVAVKNDHLQIMLESEMVPDKEETVSFVTRGLKKLNIPGIQTLTILIKRKTGDFPEWVEKINLLSDSEENLAQADIEKPLNNVLTPHASNSTSHISSQGIDVKKTENEKFCQECGALINVKAEICPKCGVRQAPVTHLASAGKFLVSSKNNREIVETGDAILWFILCLPIGFMKWGQTGKGWIWLLVALITFPILPGAAVVAAYVDYFMSFSAQKRRELEPWEVFPK